MPSTDIATDPTSGSPEPADLDTAEGTSSREVDSGIEPSAEGLEEDDHREESVRSQANQDADCSGQRESSEDLDQSEERPGSAEPPSKSADCQDKRKGWSGVSGIKLVSLAEVSLRLTDFN